MRASLGFLWGAIYIVIGTIILLDAFGIIKDVPIFKLAIALLLIAIGVKQLVVIKPENKI